MVRLPRVVVAGAPMHITQRGNNRSVIFFSREDYRLFAALLLDASQRFECLIHAYVLMTNHVHLLLTPGDENSPARLMQSVGRGYVPYFNNRYNRTGTLWERRYRSTTVDSERYLLTCSRYIELNPVRAKMVARPDQYEWSSYRYNANGAQDSLVTPHAIYRALAEDAPQRRGAYRALFNTPFESNALDAVRSATQRDAALGDSHFCEDLAATLNRPVTRLSHGGDRRSKTQAVFQRNRGEKRVT